MNSINIKGAVIFGMLLLVLFAGSVYAGVIGKGQAQIINGNEGAAKSQAKRNAIRDAVEKGAGTYLDSKTKVQNWEVIRDEVITSAVGFVKNYKIIKDEKKGAEWYFEIDAEVSESTSQIKDKLKELRILHQKMGNKRLMVIYHPEHPEALKDDHAAVLSAETTINQQLQEYGFRIYEQKSVNHLFNKINQEGRQSKFMEDWMKIANDQQVDILGEFEIAGKQKRKSSYGFAAANAEVRMKVYDVSTGRLISSVQSHQKQITDARPGSFDWSNALSKASIKAGKEVAVQSSENIVKFYKTVGDIGNDFLMVFKNFSEDEIDELLKILENFEGYQSLSEIKNVPDLVEIEYFTNLEKGRLRRKIRLAGKKKGIKIITEEISGNRFVFSKSLE